MFRINRDSFFDASFNYLIHFPIVIHRLGLLVPNTFGMSDKELDLELIKDLIDIKIFERT